MTIGDYLVERLYDLGVRHIFAVPGPFLDELIARCDGAGLTVVTPVDGQSAGFMADAYVRMRGRGVWVSRLVDAGPARCNWSIPSPKPTPSGRPCWSSAARLAWRSRSFIPCSTAGAIPARCGRSSPRSPLPRCLSMTRISASARSSACWLLSKGKPDRRRACHRDGAGPRPHRPDPPSARRSSRRPSHGRRGPNHGCP